MDAALVATPLVPFGVAFVLLVAGFVRTRAGDGTRAWIERAAGPLSVAGVGLAFAFAVAGLVAQSGGTPVSVDALWWRVGDLEIPFSLRMDGFGAIMAVVVSGVSVLVHTFSIGYMRGERNYVLYFAELSLFSGAMLLLVLADNFFLLYVAWELVGASSYLLISFYYWRPEAAAAGKKAFLTTRLGDIGLLIGIFAIITFTGVLGYEEVFAAADAGALGNAWAVAVPLLIFAGAVGKSAQFPLHVWLPDAMEGPTPVSALIHAATMVAAGVYLVARTFPLFEAAPEALTVVAWVGAFTALFAATIAVTQRDIKRVLAYSTISQLGYMMAALGAGSAEAGIFHLFTHAWFKALLFLGAGSVIHATGVQTIDELGGLAKKMPITAWTFVVGALALAGIPPFAGFWSKEEILASLLVGEPFLLAVLLVTTFLTAFYAFRLVFLIFFSPEKESHAHESGWVMAGPLIVLAVMASIAGFFGVSWLGAPLLHTLDLPVAEESHGSTVWLLLLGIALAGAGLATAWWGYGSDRGVESDRRLQQRLGWFYVAASHGYYMDRLYHVAVIAPLLGLTRFLAWTVDNRAIDGFVNGLARASVFFGAALRRLQTGEVRDYLAAMAVGTVVVAAVLWGVL